MLLTTGPVTGGNTIFHFILFFIILFILPPPQLHRNQHQAANLRVSRRHQSSNHRQGNDAAKDGQPRLSHRLPRRKRRRHLHDDVIFVVTSRRWPEAQDGQRSLRRTSSTFGSSGLRLYQSPPDGSGRSRQRRQWRRQRDESDASARESQGKAFDSGGVEQTVGRCVGRSRRENVGNQRQISQRIADFDRFFFFFTFRF